MNTVATLATVGFPVLALTLAFVYLLHLNDCSPSLFAQTRGGDR